LPISEVVVSGLLSSSMIRRYILGWLGMVLS